MKRKLKIATTGCNNVTMTIKVTKSCLSNRKADQATLARVKQTNKKKRESLKEGRTRVSMNEEDGKSNKKKRYIYIYIYYVQSTKKGKPRQRNALAKDGSRIVEVLLYSQNQAANGAPLETAKDNDPPRTWWRKNK